LDQAGRGILFAHNLDPAIKDALKELMEWRKPQVGEFYYEFEGYKANLESISSSYGRRPNRSLVDLNPFARDDQTDDPARVRVGGKGDDAPIQERLSDRHASAIADRRTGDRSSPIGREPLLG
jgi:hypothetical protein